jgi:putative endonuclease
MFYVYVINSNKGLYIGYTKDLTKRLAEHNAGKGLYTRRSRNWKVIYYEAHTNETDAKRREHYFKSSYGGISLKRMLREALNEEG